jgi:hypothetical protein
MESDSRVLYSGNAVLSNKESRFRVHVTMGLCVKSGYLEVSAKLSDSGLCVMLVSLHLQELLADVTKEDIDAASVSGEESFWHEKIVPYIKRCLCVQETVEGGGFHMTLNCDPSLFIGSGVEKPHPIREEERHLRRPTSLAVPRTSMRSAHTPLAQQKSADPTQTSADVCDGAMVSKAPPRSALGFLRQAFGGCAGALVCAPEEGDVVDEILRYHTSEAAHYEKAPGDTPLNRWELYKMTSQLRVDFKRSTPSHMAAAFDAVKETEDLKVVFRGLGSSSVGTFGAQILLHTSDRLFEVVVYDAEHNLGVMARVYVEYDQLLAAVDVCQIDRLYHKSVDAPRWKGFNGVGVTNDTMRSEAALKVMSEYLLRHLVVYRLPCIGAVVVQLAPDSSDDERGSIKVHNEPPANRNSLPRPTNIQTYVCLLAFRPSTVLSNSNPCIRVIAAAEHSPMRTLRSAAR